MSSGAEFLIGIDETTQGVGAKARSLAKLRAAGFNVPAFGVVIKCEYLQDAEVLAQDIRNRLPAGSYAVRSSAGIEDGALNSHAGQFKTKLDVGPEELSKAILEVLAHAQEKIELKDFALIVQEFIEPTRAGVTFTRNPLGSREMVTEWVKGRGETLVGGQAKPVREAFYWTERASDFKRIETLFDGPQDIEWCERSGVRFYLQSRPITSLTREQFEMFVRLDRASAEAKGALAKTGVTEVAPRPTPFTLSLLRLLYSSGGPIAKVYRSLGIRYRDTSFLRVIGNELYVDEARERASLFSFLNLVRFSLLPWKANEARASELERALLSRLAAPPYGLESFLKDYELIFEVNLLCGSAIARLKSALREESLANLLGIREKFDVKHGDWRGNSLEIADEAPFVVATGNTAPESELSPFRERVLRPLINSARRWEKLRELGRWLMVKNMNELRRTYSPFVRIGEPMLGAEELKARECDYMAWNQVTHPLRIDKKLKSAPSSKLVGASSGLASGRVVRVDELTTCIDKVILFTEVLSPDLAPYLNRVEGIISESGGVLSHLALLARECGKPLVLGADARWLGRHVTIDGTNGRIELNE